MNDDELLERRREINRKAATKSRRKQKDQELAVRKKYYDAQSTHTKLSYEKTQLTKELEEYLTRLKNHRPTCLRPETLPEPNRFLLANQPQDASDKRHTMAPFLRYSQYSDALEFVPGLRISRSSSSECIPNQAYVGGSSTAMDYQPGTKNESDIMFSNSRRLSSSSSLERSYSCPCPPTATAVQTNTVRLFETESTEASDSDDTDISSQLDLSQASLEGVNYITCDEESVEIYSKYDESAEALDFERFRESIADDSPSDYSQRTTLLDLNSSQILLKPDSQLRNDKSPASVTENTMSNIWPCSGELIARGPDSSKQTISLVKYLQDDSLSSEDLFPNVEFDTLDCRKTLVNSNSFINSEMPSISVEGFIEANVRYQPEINAQSATPVDESRLWIPRSNRRLCETTTSQVGENWSPPMTALRSPFQRNSAAQTNELVRDDLEDRLTDRILYAKHIEASHCKWNKNSISETEKTKICESLPSTSSAVSFEGFEPDSDSLLSSSSVSRLEIERDIFPLENTCYPITESSPKFLNNKTFNPGHTTDINTPFHESSDDISYPKNKIKVTLCSDYRGSSLFDSYNSGNTEIRPSEYVKVKSISGASSFKHIDPAQKAVRFNLDVTERVQDQEDILQSDGVIPSLSGLLKLPTILMETSSAYTETIGSAGRVRWGKDSNRASKRKMSLDSRSMSLDSRSETISKSIIEKDESLASEAKTINQQNVSKMIPTHVEHFNAENN